MSEIQALDVRIPAEIINNWGWFLAFGIGLVLLGVLAVVRSVTATVVSMLFFGWLLLIAAGIEVVQAVMVGKWAGLFQHWLSALLFGVLGAMIVWRPVVTAEILTLLMGAFFLVAGLFQLITPFVISLPEWGWHALNGLITLVLGVLILAQWPVSGLWVIGLFLGIELIFYGGAWIAVATVREPEGGGASIMRRPAVRFARHRFLARQGLPGVFRAIGYSRARPLKG